MKKDLAGRVFGRLTAVSVIGIKQKRQLWHCVCECGKTVDVVSSALISGHTQSCGCFHREQLIGAATAANTKHGLSHTLEHRSWLDCQYRCTNPENRSYHRYGARGIKVCDRWVNSFEDFLADMGQKPSARHTLDRIDNNGNYEPGNCRWASKKEQANNRKSSRLIEFRGRTQTLQQWAEETGIPHTTILNRLGRGLPPEIALSGKTRLKHTRHCSTD